MQQDIDKKYNKMNLKQLTLKMRTDTHCFSFAEK